MFLPLGDSPNPPGHAWVTWLLIAANIAVYVVLLPLSFQSPDPDDPGARAYLQAIASERDVGARVGAGATDRAEDDRVVAGAAINVLDRKSVV